MPTRTKILLAITIVIAAAIFLVLLSISNVLGQSIPPTNKIPTIERHAGATALCSDGFYSYATHTQGQCSSHGGIKETL